MIICAKCRKPAPVYSLVLWRGPNGYRRYKLCPACEDAVNGVKKPKKMRIVIPEKPRKE